MLSSRERLLERQGQHAPPRHEYLQQIIGEFQHSPDLLRKEEIIANLANFAYDPINYASLGHLRIMKFFLDILVDDQNGEGNQNGEAILRSKSQTKKELTRIYSLHKKHLVEFALGGICNCIPDPTLQQDFIKDDGVKIVAPYILNFSLEKELTSTSELNVIVFSITIAYFLLDSSAFAEITSDKFLDKLKSLQSHRTVQIANTAASFFSRHLELTQSSNNKSVVS